MKVSEFSCPFAHARKASGVGHMDDQSDPVTMFLRLKDVRKFAHNWKVFQSAAVPGRIVIPSEVNIRDIRQIPFEVDPPEHGNFRAILDPWFKRPLESDYQQKLEKIISDVIDHALSQSDFDVVTEFALVLQSRALTLLLNTPFEESKTWISWGTHVFRSDGEALDAAKANILYDYLDKEIDRASDNPTDDLYSVLLGSTVNGKKLTKEEVKGITTLTFAGGRDTVINAVTNSIAYLADNPEALVKLKENPEMINGAVEEFIRYFSPLTQMGRVVTTDTEVCEHAQKADSKVSLCWASANRDERTFERADEVVLDRKLNPHVGFGFSHHNCLGATHARQILRTLLSQMSQRITSINVLDHKDNIEELGEFQRKVGFDMLTVNLLGK